MSQLLLAVLAAVLCTTVLSAANAGRGYSAYRDRLGFGNATNGTLLTGIASAPVSGTFRGVVLPSGTIAERRGAGIRDTPI